MRHARRTQYLLDCTHQPLRVFEHDLIKLAPLILVDLALLQGFQVKANRGNGRLQFVGDGVQETVLLLVATHLAHQKDGVQNHSGNDESEEQDTEEQRDDLAPVENDPTYVEDQRNSCHKHAESDGEGEGLLATRDAHGAVRGRIALAESASQVGVSGRLDLETKWERHETLRSVPLWLLVRIRARNNQSPLQGAASASSGLSSGFTTG